MAINETKLAKWHLRKLNALRKSVGDTLGEEVFARWLETQSALKPEPDQIVGKISNALSNFENDSSFRLGNYGYTIRRARGKGKSGFNITKNEKPR